jgi:hypothetical protein
MFPFERFMAVLKKYVRKHSRPEGCIAKGYGTEEVIEFCVDYLPDLNPIGLPVSHHEGRLKGKGTSRLAGVGRSKPARRSRGARGRLRYQKEDQITREEKCFGEYQLVLGDWENHGGAQIWLS